LIFISEAALLKHHVMFEIYTDIYNFSWWIRQCEAPCHLKSVAI